MSPARPFRRIMVANRGEIAIRVFRAATELGCETVAIYSEEDALSMHRYKADEAYLVGRGKGPIEAYLDIDDILRIARRQEVDAIHPGYGFLSENAAFARQCRAEGIVFIGPEPHHLELFGDKTAARRLALEAGLRVLPGTEEPIASDEAGLAFARENGFPLMVKAVAGGGGRGIRIVRREEELLEALERARSEARGSFGQADVYLEKYLEGAKHLEVQILGDGERVIHLFERDCSVQRRYQKLVETAPSLALDDDRRQALAADAVRLMERVGFKGAGTVEFLMEPGGHWYFLEVNPRIQVEHTVTELVTGIDLVQAQIRLAEGYRLGDPEINLPSQESVALHGFAIQCRVTTEDPKNNFLPDTGRILAYRSPAGFGVRLDAGNSHGGAVVTPYYDSLLVKVSTWGRDFAQARAKMHRALAEFRIRGLKTNIPFLENVINHPAFQAGEVDTGFVDNTPSLLEFPERQDRATKLLGYLGHLAVNPVLGPKPPGLPAPEEALRHLRPLREKPLRPGFREILLEKGPEVLRDRILAEERLLITDTTLRDAHQSLLSTRLRTYDMLPAAAAYARSLPELFSLEMWGGATFDTAIRFLKESPWERLAALREAAPNLLFQMLLRGANAVGYRNYPDNVIDSFIRESARAGVDVFRIFDSLNWLEGMKHSIASALETGRLVEGAICYTGDLLDSGGSRYDLEYYVNLARGLAAEGVHLIGIKDMAGLLKPEAAYRLVRALKAETGLPVHLHTHDTAGTGVATVLRAAEAGVDVVDLALSSLAGLTSQPSLDTVVAALEHTPRATGLDEEAVMRLARYFEVVRRHYAPFESGLKSSTAEVYHHEMPGGQYSNLRRQAEALGLGDRWDAVTEAYATANRLLGDIIKVTPSSKMVGDLALFMVQNGLDEEELYRRGEQLAFPESVVEYFQGYMGQPPGGFPERLRRLVLKGRPVLEGRPGAQLPPVDFEAERERLGRRTRRPAAAVGQQEVLASLLYPQPWMDFIDHQDRFGDTSVLDTPTFFYGLEPGEETVVELEQGKTLYIRLTAVGELREDGTRPVYFELNGQPREVAVRDEKAAGEEAARPPVDPDDLRQVGASMPGRVLRVYAAVGEEVEKGAPLLVVEAMKMETTLTAPVTGRVVELLAAEGDLVRPGELLVRLADEGR